MKKFSPAYPLRSSRGTHVFFQCLSTVKCPTWNPFARRVFQRIFFETLHVTEYSLCRQSCSVVVFQSLKRGAETESIRQVCLQIYRHPAPSLQNLLPLSLLPSHLFKAMRAPDSSLIYPIYRRVVLR